MAIRVRNALLGCLGLGIPGAGTDPSTGAGQGAGLDRGLREMAAKLVDFTSDEFERLVGLANDHGVAPLLYRVLKQIGEEDRHQSTKRPLEVALGRLRKIYETNTIKNLRIYHELKAVAAALGKAGIPMILLKGSHLARGVYRDLGLRQMCDVDVLLRKTDLARAQDVLFSIGYTHPQYTADGTKHLHPFTKDGIVVIEAHWTILQDDEPPEVDMAGLWKRARPATGIVEGALVLSPEDLLLHLCLHCAYSHGFDGGLRAICDVAEALSSFGEMLSWKLALGTTQRWRVERSVAIVLRLTRDLIGMAIPADAEKHYDVEGIDGEILSIAREQLFGDDGGQGAISTTAPAGRSGEAIEQSETAGVDSHQANAVQASGLLAKLALMRRILFLKPSQMRVKYQTNHPYLAYLIRPFDLLFRNSAFVARLRRREGAGEGEGAAKWRNMRNSKAIQDWVNAGLPDD